MRVLVLAPGTRGDAAPAAGLAAAFVADGHEVTLVAGADYAAFADDAQCAHVAITASMTPAGTLADTETSERSGPAGVRAYLAALRQYMDAAASAALSAVDGGADVVLTNAISPYGHDIAEHLGVPSAAALLQPAEPSAGYPPMIASARDLGAIGNRLAGTLAERIRTPYDPACARVRAELGLPPEPRAIAQRRRRRAGLPVHHGISPAVLPRPADWSDRLTLDGFWWPPPRPSWVPPAELTAFLDAGPAPVIVTFGSLPTDGEVPAHVESALRESGRRAILQGEAMRGVAMRLARDLGDDHVLHAGDVPHDWLLPRAVAMVHQAGAGISSSALRAGVPSVTVPMHTDQPFWARRLEALSAGTAPIPMRRLTAASLAARLDEATSSDVLRRGAERIARALADEEGTAPLGTWLRRLGG